MQDLLTVLASVLLVLGSSGSGPVPLRAGPGDPRSSDLVHPDLASLTPRWQEAMRATGVPALALVVVEGDEVVHRVTLGRRDPLREAPVTPDTMFYIASATKPYVAFALVRLAERGEVELDAPVRRYLPRFRLADAEATETITVRDLLCHRPGLTSGPIVLLDAYTGEITEDRFYHFLAEVEPGPPAYSNLHFTLAGRVIEAVSGQGWREHLAEHVLAPAGMTRTTGFASWMYAQEDVAMPATGGAGDVGPAAVRKSDATMHAAGGLGTSLEDLARWLRLQLGRGRIDGVELLSAAGTEETWRLHCATRGNADFGAMEGFGLGWQRGHYRGHLELRHGGGYVGSASFVAFLPELGLGLGVLATGERAMALARLVSTDVHERLLADDRERDLMPELLASARAGPATGARPARELAGLALPLARHAGTYRNEWLGTLVLEPAGTGLVGRLGELGFELAGAGPERVRMSSDGPLDGLEAVLELAGEDVTGLVLELPREQGGPARFAR